MKVLGGVAAASLGREKEREGDGGGGLGLIWDVPMCPGSRNGALYWSQALGPWSGPVSWASGWFDRVGEVWQRAVENPPKQKLETIAHNKLKATVVFTKKPQ